MGQMIVDKTMQCFQRRSFSKVGVGDDAVDDHGAVIQQDLDEIVAGATKPVQRGLADSRGLGNLFERRPGVINDGYCQGFQLPLW